jgi:hypothetical protein
MVNFISIIIVTALITGCASKTLDIMPKQPSEDTIEEFNQYSCNQIKNKISFTEKKVQRLGRVQNDNVKSDRALIFLGLAGLFFLDGDGEAKEQFETALGEKDALQEIAIKKDCKFDSMEYHHTFEGSY